jgi:hypothetical protein
MSRNPVDTADRDQKRRQRSPRKPRSTKAAQRPAPAALAERAVETMTDQTARPGALGNARPRTGAMIGVAGGMGVGLLLGLFLGARLLGAGRD